MSDPLSAGKPHRYFTKPPMTTRPPTLSGTGNEYRPQYGDALRLRSKGRMAYYMWINVWLAGKTVLSLVNTCQPEHFRDGYCTHYKVLYKCPVYL